MTFATIVTPRGMSLGVRTERVKGASNCLPASSSPTTPIITQRAPRPATFMATLATPPGAISSRRTTSTGAGASGEMRLTSP